MIFLFIIPIILLYFAVCLQINAAQLNSDTEKIVVRMMQEKYNLHNPSELFNKVLIKCAVNPFFIKNLKKC